MASSSGSLVSPSTWRRGPVHMSTLPPWSTRKSRTMRQAVVWNDVLNEHGKSEDHLDLPTLRPSDNELRNDSHGFVIHEGNHSVAA